MNGEVAESLSLIFPGTRVSEFSRGSAGLYKIFKILKELNGAGEIVLPNLCCETVALAALCAGHKVRFADVDGQRFCVTPQSISEVMGPLTRAVVIVHLFGLTVDASAFHELRRLKPDVLFIEDVAHAAGGCDITGREVGSGFDHVMFSFSESKILGGHGGAIVSYRLDEITDRLHGQNFTTSEPKIDPLFALSLRNFTHAIADLERAGSSHAEGEIAHSFWEHFYPLVTYEGKICEASKALVDLRNRVSIRERRNSRVVNYRERINQNNIFIPEFSNLESCWRLPILAETPELRRRITDSLRHKGLQVSNHYFQLSRLFSTEDLKMSKYVSDRLINLWVDDTITDLTVTETARIINSI